MGVFRRGRLAVIGAVAGVGLMMVGTLPAAASAAGAGVVIGGGSISPGLGVLPAHQTVTFSGSLTGAGVVGTTSVVISDTCTFSGASTDQAGGDNIALGLGQVTGSCIGSLGISASLTYARVGALVAVEGPGSVTLGTTTVNGDSAGICVFVTTQTPPITSYTVVCVTAAAGP